jgi:hypothetical protein
LRGPAPLVVAGGVLLAAGYSLRPVRLADRGIVAPLALPAGYVAVPYLAGVLAVRPDVHGRDLAVLAGLYVGFVGRILLKDFRDVRGDALFGKRTFLVRHGRRATCAVSAVCWTTGVSLIATVGGITPGLVAANAVLLAGVLTLLARLAHSVDARRDEHLISALAILGRALVLVLAAHLSAAAHDWPSVGSQTFVAALAAAHLVLAASMAQHGPTRGWALRADAAPTGPVVVSAAAGAATFAAAVPGAATQARPSMRAMVGGMASSPRDTMSARSQFTGS